MEKVTNTNGGASPPPAPNLETLGKLASQLPVARWGVWRLAPRPDGKPAKEPCRYEGGELQLIKTTEPARWGSFDEACQWFEQAKGKAAGLGLLIGGGSYSSGLVGVDIDDCLDDCGELIEGLHPDLRFAVKEMKEAGVCCERSQSGRGLHMLWLGRKPDKTKEKRNLDGISREMYDGKSTRYLAVTGDMWGEASAVLKEMPISFSDSVADSLTLFEDQLDDQGEIGNPRSIDALSDNEIIQKIKQAGQGKGKRLWEGIKSDYGDDWSSSDSGLCRLIARWSDNVEQIERIWGMSALANRDKFRKRKSYRRSTIELTLNSARLTAQKQTNDKQRKSAQVTEAVKGGDVAGALASALAQWGGKVPATLGAVEAILSLDNRLTGAFAFDEFSYQVVKLRSLRVCLGDVVPPDTEPEAGQAWSDADSGALTIWLERVWATAFKSSMVEEAINIAARRRSINFVVDALEALVWDGKKRLDSFLVDYLSADDTHDSPRYLGAIGRAWMIGTVARAYDPGCKHDNVLTFESKEQGWRKSEAISVLCCVIAPQAFAEGLPSLNQGQEAERSLAGVWICELAELSFMDRATSEHSKAFLTKKHDKVRDPFARRYVKRPRTVSYAGSTNQAQFIKDNTGGRRFWVFRLRKPIDVQALREVAPQLWAEAVAAYKAGEPWYLTDAKAISDASSAQWLRVEREGLDELIADSVIDGLNSLDDAGVSSWRMQSLEVWKMVFPRSENSEYQKICKAFSGALDRCGFERKGSGGKSWVSIGPRLREAIRQANLSAKD